MAPIKILVADDEDVILNVYRRMLGPKAPNKKAELERMAQDLFDLEPASESRSFPRFDVSLFNQGDLAIQAAEQAKQKGERYAIAFLDMRMPPGKNGLQTASHLIRLDPEIEIVIVSAFSDYPRVDIAEALGKDRFLILRKPFQPEELQQIAVMLSTRWSVSREREAFERDKELFAANLAHQLRTPLNNIFYDCESILSCPEVEPIKDKVEEILSEARKLHHLSEQIQWLNQSHYYTQNFQPTCIKLEDLADQIIRIHQPDAKLRGLELCRTGQDTLPPVHADRQLLADALSHLVLNAIHYSDHGKICLDLQRGEQVRVAVVDHGLGIPQDEVENIFKRFYRIPQTIQRVEGHGLGLSLVRDLVGLHGSQVFVKSELGVGSQFWFYLPTVN